MSPAPIDVATLFGSPNEAATPFIYVLKPSEGLFARMDAADEAAIARHLAYLQAHLALGRLILAGPAGQPPAFGIVVFLADTPEQARSIADHDPAVVAGTLLLDRVLPFSLALERFRPSPTVEAL